MDQSNQPRTIKTKTLTQTMIPRVSNDSTSPEGKIRNDKLFITTLRIRHPATIPISMQVFHFNIIYAICTNQTPENYAMNNECILLGTLINYTTTVYNEYLLLWNLYSILSLTQTNLWSPEAYFGVAV